MNSSPLQPIRQALNSDRLAHAYLLYGNHPRKLRQQILEIIQGLVCKNRSGLAHCGECEPCHQVTVGSHPDLVSLEPEGPDDTVSVDAIRDEIIQPASLTPARAGYKLFWLQDIRRLTPEASNTLLKVLEEPPGDAVFLLTARSRWDCMPTIRSRCHWIRIPDHETGREQELPKHLQNLWPDHEIPEDAIDITRNLLNNEQKSDQIDWDRKLARGVLTTMLLMIQRQTRESEEAVEDGDVRLNTRHVPEILERFGELDRGIQPELIVNSLLEEIFVPEAEPEWPTAF